MGAKVGGKHDRDGGGCTWAVEGGVKVKGWGCGEIKDGRAGEQREESAGEGLGIDVWHPGALCWRGVVEGSSTSGCFGVLETLGVLLEKLSIDSKNYESHVKPESCDSPLHEIA